MTASENKALVERYLSDVSGHAKPRDLLERYVSSEGLIEHVLDIEAGFPGYELDVLELVAEGDTVACRLLFRGIHRGDFHGIEATGREATMSVCAFYEIQKGRIADAWVLADGASLIEQLTADESDG